MTEKKRARTATASLWSIRFHKPVPATSFESGPQRVVMQKSLCWLLGTSVLKIDGLAHFSRSCGIHW
jgi:hypothetical protein